MGRGRNRSPHDCDACQAMTPDQFAAWLETHYESFLGETQAKYRLCRADAEDAVHGVATHLIERGFVATLRPETADRYFLRAVKMHTRRKHRDNARHHRILTANRVEGHGAGVGVSELAEACERIVGRIRAPKLRTCAWLIYACGWELKEAVRVAGMTVKSFRRAFRREYHGIREELARFVRHGHQRRET